MGNKNFSTSSSFWVSVVLILLGVYLLLENLGFIYISDLWDYWPLILVGIGVVKLLNSKFKDIYSAGILIVIGFLLFSITTNYLYIEDIWQFWPLILVFIGARIIWNHYIRENKPGYRDSMISRDRIDAVVVFGGRELRVSSDQFEGGNITSIFGGAEIYFSNSRLARGENILDVFVMFGGAELYVPRDWNVVMKGIPIFGAFEDERRASPPEELSAENTLFIKGLVLFGGLSLKDAVV
jgi:predicted membrane protein